jgi:hypothetical protein
MDEVIDAMDLIVVVWRQRRQNTELVLAYILAWLHQSFAGQYKRTKLVYTSDVLYNESRFYVISTWCRMKLIDAMYSICVVLLSRALSNSTMMTRIIPEYICSRWLAVVLLQMNGCPDYENY